MQIRRMTPDDVQQVVEIADASPEAASWTASTYGTIIENPDRGEVWIAEEQGRLAGFAAFRLIDAEAELLNVAVHPQQRRKGLGSLLIEQILGEVVRRGVERVFLEVRASNEPALHFYAQFGFRQIGRRRDYYAKLPPTAPAALREDALLLAKDLPQAESGRPRGWETQ